MNHRLFITTLFLFALTVTVRAQVYDDNRNRILSDSIKSDYEEWLRNEPLRPESGDSMSVRPLSPSDAIVDPMELKEKQSPVSIMIMTPKLRQDMKLSYQGHWLEEQRKSQVGGAMTIGVNPLAFIGYLISKIFPKRKSKKQREREKLQQILDNY